MRNSLRLIACSARSTARSIFPSVDGRWRRREFSRRSANPVIFVGGSGLYFRALTDGLSDIPPVPEAVRAEVRNKAEGRATAELHDELRARDPETAARLNPSDRQRILRALEVVASTGRPLVSFLGARAAPVLAPGEWAGLYLAPDRAELGQRIDARFDAMLAQGALDEVAALMERRLDPALPVMRAHGVPHLIAHLGGRMTLEEAAKRSKLDTRHYAKRQFTWARHQLSGFRWVAPEEAAEAGPRCSSEARLLLGEAAFFGDVLALPATAGEASLPVLAAFCETPGEPLSVLAQKPWQVLSRSEQLFASAGAVSARTSAAAAQSGAPKRNSRIFASHSADRSQTLSVSAFICNPELEVSARSRLVTLVQSGRRDLAKPRWTPASACVTAQLRLIAPVQIDRSRVAGDRLCRKSEPMESTSNMKASGARATRSFCSSWASAPS